MRCFLTIILTVMLFAAFPVAAEAPKPFYWAYDINYKYKKQTYRGNGYYQLATNGEESIFTLGFKSRNKLISQREWVVFTPHNEHVAIPQYRQKHTKVLGFPKKQTTQMHPPAKGAYYDAMTAVLRILNDVRVQQGEKKSWSLYHADEQKTYNFTLVGEETLRLPLGEIECYVIYKEDHRLERSLRMWVAKNGNYIAAMENKRRNSLLRLEIKGLTES